MRRSPTDEHGFTLVELMVAALVLVVGMLATLGVLSTGFKKTTLNSQRVAATNLARELTETARQVSYTNLTPAALETALRTGAADLGSGTPWQIVRRRTTYTVTARVCTYDDPADGVASPAPDNRCADNPGSATLDPNGDDFRRVTFDVSWRAQDGPQTFTQSTLIVNPSGGLGPRIVKFTKRVATITSGDFATFDLETTWAEAIHWNTDDGQSTGDATMTGPSHKLWTIDWNLGPAGAPGSVLDGTYNVIAQAFDDRNIAGDAKVETITINRSEPFAPTNFKGGHNTRAGGWVDLEWSLNKERDIQGYQVYWAGPDGQVGTADDRLVCPAADSDRPYLDRNITTCQDKSPQSGAQRYYIVALDLVPPSGPGVRPGRRTELAIPAAGARLNPPDNPRVTYGADAATVSWAPPSGGGSVLFYRVYRGGTGVDDRIAKSNLETYTDPEGTTGQPRYWVSAVDANFNESNLVEATP